MFVAMASNACHILEAALEQMDDIIAGKSCSPHYLKNMAASFVIAGLHGYEKCSFDMYTNRKFRQSSEEGGSACFFSVEVTYF